MPEAIGPREVKDQVEGPPFNQFAFSDVGEVAHDGYGLAIGMFSAAADPDDFDFLPEKCFDDMGADVAG